MLCEFKLSHSAAEAARNIALAFGTDSPSERTVRCWFAKFSSGDFDLEDKPGRGRRMSLDDQALRAAVETKPDTTTRTLAAGLAVHYATVSKHLASIGMVRKMQKWTPHDLTDDQQSTRYEICSNFLVCQKNEPFLDRLITVDGKWLLFDNKKRGYVRVDTFSTLPSFPKPDLHPRKVGNMSDGNLPEVLSTGITGINDADTRFMQDELGGRSLTMCHFIIFNFCVGFFGYYIWLIFPRPKSNETYRTNQKPSGESR
ncbi:hypothetical protein Y032_0228g2876 [Ancylostoma ceylanicum]|uniref:Mos1 transposase HTH domain-containing protein n=2 Tax=Ancylostoma ceylanicum TaxID=53326 RepID=A0A016SGL0_9BILA|nr:hypothetical protein Y032_0228g2876 [Ancylostoma ceylanicum]